MKKLLLTILAVLTFVVSGRAQTGQFYPSELFSSGLINKVCQDRYGYIWVATDYGLNRFDGYRFTTFLHHDEDSTSLYNNTVVSLFCDSDNQLWVGTAKGLDRFDYATESFRHYRLSQNFLPRVTNITQSPKGRMYFLSSGYGMFTLDGDSAYRVSEDITTAEEKDYWSQIGNDSKGRIFKSGFSDVVTVLETDRKKLTLRSPYGNVSAFIERNGSMLVFGIHGISHYENGQLLPAGIDQTALGSSGVYFSTAYKDRSNNIYIGTRGDGLFMLPDGSNRIERLECTVKDFDLNSAKVYDIMEDRLGNLWVACHSKGLLMIRHAAPKFQSWGFERQGKSLGSTISSICEGDGGMTWVTVQGNGVFGFNDKGQMVSQPSCPPNAEFIFRDRQGQYWIGTDDALYAYNPLTGSSQRRVTFECDKFNDMTSDNYGKIYISTYSRGFCVYNPKTGALRNYYHTYDGRNTDPKGWLCNNWILAMMPDRNGNIWLATSSGVTCFDPRTESFRPYGWMQLLPEVMCLSLCETKGGTILIGTSQGLYYYEKGRQEAKPATGSEALSDKPVGYIVQAGNGDIWCSTPMGLWQYDTRKNVYIGYIKGSGLNSKEYVNGVGLHADNDMIYFANNEGLTVFHPSDIVVSNVSVPDVQLTGFFVAGRPIGSGPVITTDRFEVSYLETALSLEFSLLDFNNPQNVIFEYRIGNGQWIQKPEGQNTVQLSNLTDGVYNIEVRALSDGVYSKTKVITIEVTPPWYRSRLAWLLYFVAFLGILLLGLWMLRRRASQQLDEEKMKFLINATHDIRSPLTIILSALKKLKGEANPAVDSIEHNAQRILNLVNQILDMRKIDKQQMHLHCQETDMVAFTSAICHLFDFTAQERNITFRFDHPDLQQLPAWVDRTQFDKVINNLLSNAFKYSNDGGEVTVSLREAGGRLELTVADSGIGLDENSLKHAFDRFYQGDSSRRMNTAGTGIGLNLCKMIVSMHHGTIEAQNRTDATGALFTVRIPLGKEHLKTEEMEEKAPVLPTVSHTASTTKSRVLVVDDDLEIANYISTELGRYYHFSIRPNGREGLKELLSNEYDIVVSDVMMPEMDGMTMLRMIKTNFNIAHIPVIMLTSKADVANRLEGLERGADAFLAKPFDMDELHVVIDNLIQSRKQLKGKYSGIQQQQAEQIDDLQVKGNDEQLMERIMKSINKNLSDSDFNVEMLTQEVGISRAQLHRKMKELTGLSTSDFIRNIRLEQAARLLKEQKINVTQVAYTVGFSNLAHFSTVFRKHFGMTPSEYIEREGA
jgi:signal transduction histidine kinase/DNA-binding response OmpR family regulator/ligand-binding sensor domain-containing protein